MNTTHIDLAYGSEILRLYSDGVNKIVSNEEERLIRRSKIDRALLSTTDATRYDAWVVEQEDYCRKAGY